MATFEPFTITARLTKRQIMSARLFVYFRSGWGVGILLVGSAVAAANVGGISRGYGGSLFQSVFMPLFVTGFAIPFGIAFGGINSSGTKKLVSSDVQYECTPEGLTGRTPWGHVSLAWSEFSRAYETSSRILLVAHGALYLLPMAAMPSHSISPFLTHVRLAMKQKAGPSSKGVT